jgi:hypothetical protein
MSHLISSTRLWLVAIFAAAALPNAAAQADSLTEDSFKAGFVFNFIKYVEWPKAKAGNGLLVCRLSTQTLSGKLESLQGRQVQGREIRVSTTTRPGDWRNCAVLFIAAAEAQHIDAVLRATAQHPVLTISDAPGFVQAGGIIGLKLRAGRIAFDINHGAARQAGLNLSSQLLKLADEVLP